MGSVSFVGSGKKKREFLLRTSEHDLRLTAASDSDRDAWVNALKSVWTEAGSGTISRQRGQSIKVGGTSEDTVVDEGTATKQLSGVTEESEDDALLYDDAVANTA